MWTQRGLFVWCVLSCLVVRGAWGHACQVTATSSTTQDATIVSEIALVTEFALQCTGGAAPTSLYADIDGLVTSVARVGDQFQVSWTEELKKARSGDRVVRIFDEEGYAALRKVLRSGGGNEVHPLATVIVHHPGAFTGPWLKSEFMAATLAVIVAYAAFSSKAKLLA